SAGITPKSSGVKSDSTAVKITTRRSKATDSARGSASPTSESIASIAARASSRPAAPPIAARTRPSVTSCRTTRAGLAPRAARLLEGDARLQPRDARIVVHHAPPLTLAWGIGDWQQHRRRLEVAPVAARRKLKAIAHDADDRVRLAIERDRAADDVRIAAERA